MTPPPPLVDQTALLGEILAELRALRRDLTHPASHGAPDVLAAKAAAAAQFDLDEIQRNRIMVQELG